MEANICVGTPPVTAVSTGCAYELTRSSSDTSSLTAGCCKDCLRCSENVMQDDCSEWTNEKHNLYLNHLEVSFVQQLHQSKGLLTQCSDQDQRDVNSSHKRPVDVHNTLQQFTVLRNGYWKKISYEKHEPLSRAQADSCRPLKNPWIYRFGRCIVSSPSTDMQELVKLRAEKCGKGVISHGLATSSHRFSANNPYQGALFELTQEGKGENFSDESNHVEPHAKRLKTVLVKHSSHDQIVPSM